MRPPDKLRGRPGQETAPQDDARGDGTRDSVTDAGQPPIALATALAELLELSDERDMWQQRLGDEYRIGWKLGYAAGVDEGRRLEADERDRAWNAAAGSIARGGPAYAELSRRRWGPGGRDHFGDPRPGDRFGRQEGAA